MKERGALGKLKRTINEKVIDWNRNGLRVKDYYDLHGMTTNGAVRFVLGIVENMQFYGSEFAIFV